MPLKKSISGIRGTIGGKPGDNLTPFELLKFSAAYSAFLHTKNKTSKPHIIVGRDARTSGEMVSSIVKGTLFACGIDVTDCGLATTPTVEMAVIETKADGGIIFTASHNPANWNALKLLDNKGEFLSDIDGKKILEIAEKSEFTFVQNNKLGVGKYCDKYLRMHIKKILELRLVDTDAIKKAKFKVAFDAINSVGGIALPELFSALCVETIYGINQTPDGHFAHNPEPIPENLKGLSKLVLKNRADVGFAVDPDVDRLAIVCETGEMFGEEYTLVAIADYILQNQKGNTVSNLSSTRALKDVTIKHKGRYSASAVGEVNVVKLMKKTNAVIGGEGNGGIIYPKLHYGRDALVGIALFLSYIAKRKITCSELRSIYPKYYISKNKLELAEDTNLKKILNDFANLYENANTIDGVKINFDNAWIHVRASNTEPIIRIFAEAKTIKKADDLAHKAIQQIQNLL